MKEGLVTIDSYKRISPKSVDPKSQSDGDNNDSAGQYESDTGVLEKTKVAEPSLYKVLLMNDDFTPMDFVTQVLQKFYHKTLEESQQVMMEVHQKGKGIAGVYTFEVAETKVFMTNNYAKQNKYPLQCTMEEE